METEIIFDVKGNARCIYSDEAAEILRDVGETVVRRASHVEPFMDGWVADMRPVGGPVLPVGGATRYGTRREALEAERLWILAHDIPVPSE